MVLLEKGIPFEWKDIKLRDENGVALLERKREIYPELYELNPNGKVPVIQHQGKAIYESLVVDEYLDDVFDQGTKLLPKDPYERVSENFSLFSIYLFSIYFICLFYFILINLFFSSFLLIIYFYKI